MRKTILLSSLAVLVSAAGICWAAGMATVDQRGLAFSISKLVVKKGDIVTFTNNDNTSHNILVSGNGVSLNSGLQKPGVAFKAPFIKPGIYQVNCGIHPKMKMSIVVE